MQPAAGKALIDFFLSQESMSIMAKTGDTETPKLVPQGDSR
jgi:ABC-type Fe3+ transport system substrate-binding protein